MKLNLGCGRDVRDGWINMDLFYEDPRVIKHDLLETPWPFPNNTFKHIEARHVFEHIPVILRNGRDIIFDIFEEAHRVMTPGAQFVIDVPWGRTDPSIDHIQHYRAFLPETFLFLQPSHREHYYTTANFHIQWQRTRNLIHAPHKRYLRLRGLGLTDHLMTRFPLLRQILEQPAGLRITLKALK